MKPLVFAQGLRMIGPAMRHGHPHPPEPHRQGRVAMHGITAPGTAIIHQQAIRQPIAPKRRDQGLLHGRRLLIRQHPEPDVKAGMIIQNRQRVRRPRHGGHCALEVHLPQLIGDRVFKPAAGRRAPHLVGPEQPPPSQEGRDRATRRHRGQPLQHHALPQLARAPTGMRLALCQERVPDHRRDRGP